MQIPGCRPNKMSVAYDKFRSTGLEQGLSGPVIFNRFVQETMHAEKTDKK